MQTFQLTLIRHGQTSLNEERRYQGWSDSPLSINGAIELKNTKLSLIKHKFHQIFCSDLLRARQSAAILFPMHESITYTPLLRELSFGDWEGLTYEECMALESGNYSKWIDDPTSHSPPNGESVQNMTNRIKLFISELKKQAATFENPHIAAVTHGGPIRVVSQLYNDPTVQLNTISVPPPGGWRTFTINQLQEI